MSDDIEVKFPHISWRLGGTWYFRRWGFSLNEGCYPNFHLSWCYAWRSTTRWYCYIALGPQLKWVNFNRQNLQKLNVSPEPETYSYFAWIPHKITGGSWTWLRHVYVVKWWDEDNGS